MRIMADYHKRYGYDGEQLAAEYLQQLGYIILARNFRVHGVGELDIIALQGQMLVVAEVKHWLYYPIRQLEYVIDERKKKRLGKATEVFLQQNPVYQNYLLRFDLLFVEGKSSKIRHLTSILE